MQPTDLEPHERQVLVGLVRHLAGLDDVVSHPELTWVRGLIDTLGQETWHQLAHQSRKVHPLELAPMVMRPDARALIRRLLVELAETDEIVPDEAALLARLDALWAEAP